MRRRRRTARRGALRWDGGENRLRIREGSAGWRDRVRGGSKAANRRGAGAGMTRLERHSALLARFFRVSDGFGIGMRRRMLDRLAPNAIFAWRGNQLLLETLIN